MISQLVRRDYFIDTALAEASQEALLNHTDSSVFVKPYFGYETFDLTGGLDASSHTQGFVAGFTKNWNQAQVLARTLVTKRWTAALPQCLQSTLPWHTPVLTTPIRLPRLMIFRCISRDEPPLHTSKRNRPYDGRQDFVCFAEVAGIQRQLILWRQLECHALNRHQSGNRIVLFGRSYRVV